MYPASGATLSGGSTVEARRVEVEENATLDGANAEAADRRDAANKNFIVAVFVYSFCFVDDLMVIQQLVISQLCRIYYFE